MNTHIKYKQTKAIKKSKVIEKEVPRQEKRMNARKTRELGSKLLALKMKISVSPFKTHAHRMALTELRRDNSEPTAQRTNSICNIHNGQTLCFPDGLGANELLVNLLSGV